MEVDCHRLPRFFPLQTHVDPVIHNLQKRHTHKQLNYNVHAKRYNNERTNLKLHEDNKSESVHALILGAETHKDHNPEI